MKRDACATDSAAPSRWSNRKTGIVADLEHCGYLMRITGAHDYTSKSGDLSV
jgi:hypothetical protein